MDKFGKEQIKAIVDVRLSDFITKNLDEKYALIEDSWKKYYPEIFIERSRFEDAMGYYRYTPNDGWSHTAYIADNYKAVDFYKGKVDTEGIIEADIAISMKTTTTKDANKWLETEAIQKNIKFLKQGLDVGMPSNNTKMFIKKAEIHIYVPKENITPELKTDWIKKLKDIAPGIKIEISSLENFIK